MLYDAFHFTNKNETHNKEEVERMQRIFYKLPYTAKK